MRASSTSLGRLKTTGNAAAGFTLIELMITVVIIGILASIAIPSYQDYVRQSRRAEAQSEMMRLALNEEKYRANNPTYADHTVAAMGIANTSYYTFTIVATGSTYTISATAQGSQATDAACTPLTLNEKGEKGPSGCWKS